VIASVYMHSSANLPLGGFMHRDSLIVWSLHDHNTIFEFDFDCYMFGSTPPLALDRFALAGEQDIHSVYNLLREQMNAALVRGRYIAIRTDIADLQYVMIAPSPRSEIGLGQEMTEGRTWFDFMPMQGRFFDQDVFAQHFWQIQGDSFATDVPYHLFDDSSLFYATGAYDFDSFHGVVNNVDLAHQIGHYYRIYGNMADFRAFYESLGLYEIVETDDQLILTSSAHIMTLSFQEDNGQHYVVFSFEKG